jgi:hypothetical protein
MKSGACRSEGLITGQHVPDRGRELAGKIDLRHLRAALAAVATLQALVALLVERMAVGMDGGLHQSPAQIPGTALGHRPTEIKSNADDVRRVEAQRRCDATRGQASALLLEA